VRVPGLVDGGKLTLAQEGDLLVSEELLLNHGVGGQHVPAIEQNQC